MSLFSKIFRFSSDDGEQPKIVFGRYSDSYKSAEKYKAWDKSVELFESRDYLESYRQFLEYLSDDQISNVQVSQDDEDIVFSLYQGSKKIEGRINDGHIFAEAK